MRIMLKMISKMMMNKNNSSNNKTNQIKQKKKEIATTTIKINLKNREILLLYQILSKQDLQLLHHNKCLTYKKLEVCSVRNPLSKLTLNLSNFSSKTIHKDSKITEISIIITIITIIIIIKDLIITLTITIHKAKTM